MTTIDNGVNVQALLDAREVLKGAPEAAQFTWRATSRWQNGVHSTTTIQNFFGLGEEQTHKTETVFDADHPEVFAAHGQRHHADRVSPGRPGELPHGRGGVRGPEPRDPAAVDRVDGRGQPRHPRHPRCRQRCPQRVQRRQGDVQRSTRTHRSRRSRRWSPSPRSAPRSSTPSRTPRTSPSRLPEGRAHRARHNGRHRRRPRRPCRQSLPQRPVDRPRRARARRGGELLAARTLGLPAAADSQLAEPAAGPPLRRPGSRRLHDHGRGHRAHRALRRQLGRSGPDGHERHLGAAHRRRLPGDDEPRRDRLPDGGHREWRLQPAERARGSARRCRPASSS